MNVSDKNKTRLTVGSVITAIAVVLECVLNNQILPALGAP